MENYLSTITNYLLTQSWQIAVLVVLIAAVNLALKNRSAHVRYLLWLIVLAKCLVPPLLTVPLAVLPQERYAEPVRVLPAQMLTAFEAMDMPEAEVPVSPVVAVPVPTVIEKTARLSSRQWIGFGWIVGVAAFFLFAVIKALRTDFWLWRQRKLLPAEAQTGIENLFSGFGIKTFPKVWLVEGIGQPFVWGLLRGTIYLPADFVKVNSAEHRRGVLGHELGHILRFDAAVNLLQIIAQAVFWFHPFVWWANKKIRAEREKCCDEMAIARLGAKAKDYSAAIVNILICEHESTRPVPSLAVAGPVKNIEERIKTMMKPGKKFYKRPSIIAVTVILLLALWTVPTALVLTARAETKAATEPETKSTKSLHQAAADGDIDQVKSNLSQGADINGKDRGGRTALHRAAYESRTDVVRLLIDRGADVNAKDGNQRTPLHSAAMHGDKKTVELLLSKGADINAKNKRGSTPLFVAMTSTRAGRKEVAELMVAKGAKIPAFHLAAYIGDIEELKKCLQDGIDINSQADVGSTALHLAANSGRKDIVEFLISKGAQVDAKDVFDWTPLLYAASHNYEDIADLLLAKGADVNAKDKWGYTLLYNTIWNEDKDVAKLLIAKGADVNAKDYMGYTLLCSAARYGYIDVAELLLTKGATNVNASGGGNWGYTLLHWACMNGHKDVAELLIAKGADVNAQNIIGVTPLHVAAGRGHTKIVELLLAKKADVNAKDNQGATPLWYAKNGVIFSFSAFGKLTKGAKRVWDAKNPGCKEIVELLRKQGGKEEAPVLSLHEAAAVGDIEQVKSLISKGADVNAMDDRLDGTPMHLAAFYYQRQVVELLIANGANVNAKNKWDRTPLHVAIRRYPHRGHTEIVELLRKHGAKVEISVGAAKTRPAKLLLESATSKFAIPKKNLEIPEHMQSSVENLRKIYAAIKKYEKDKGKLPNWLSDLVPEYVSKETLLCPPDPKHKARVFRDPKLPCNYNYEFMAGRKLARFGGSPVDGMTARDWKAAEMKLFGDVMPLVRCGRDGRWGMLLNISVGGEIYMSQIVWEKMFIPDYTLGLELSKESLR